METAPQAAPALPATTSAISGKNCAFAENPLNVHTIRLDFDAPDEATFLLDLRNEPEPRLTGVGLDGLFRNSITGQTVIARGNWLDDETFIDYSEGPGLSNYVMKLYFVGDQVEFEINIPGLAGHPIVGTEG